MKVKNGFIDSIGNTPLIRLRTLSQETVAAAVTLAKQTGPGHTIVTILCDGGAKYQSRLFNKAWLAERGFLDAIS